ncbi:hypothetical protein MHTCC0001_08590 [Flavobacteriaceae bacterium MHTCC 0001]
MKRDIRDLFKDNEVTKHQIPEGHREEFYTKLTKPKKNGLNTSNYQWVFKVAAMLLVCIAMGYFLIPKDDASNVKHKERFTTQIKAIERKYKASINKEWKNFLLLTEDKNLVHKYKKRLDDLDADYKEISKHYKDDTDEILIIEALVENLQTRLNLLKDIQKHINLLNKQNEHYETTL